MFNSLAKYISLSEMISGVSPLMFALFMISTILHICSQVCRDPALLLVLVSMKYFSSLAFFTSYRTSLRASLASALDSLVVAIIRTGIRKKSKSVFMSVDLEYDSRCVVDVPKLAHA